jgi:geranylgeranylglycerol-phosphate geranylgeranyltransferase
MTREIVKDVEDIGGDWSEGLQTLPITIGEVRALQLAAGVLVVAVLASPVPYLRGTFGLAYLALVAPADAIMLYAAHAGFENPGRSQSLLKYGMFLAAAAFVAGRAAVLV